MVLINRVPEVTDLEDWLTVMGFEQDILQLDVPVCHSHSAQCSMMKFKDLVALPGYQVDSPARAQTAQILGLSDGKTCFTYACSRLRASAAGTTIWRCPRSVRGGS